MNKHFPFYLYYQITMGHDNWFGWKVVARPSDGKLGIEFTSGQSNISPGSCCYSQENDIDFNTFQGLEDVPELESITEWYPRIIGFEKAGEKYSGNYVVWIDAPEFKFGGRSFRKTYTGGLGNIPVVFSVEEFE